MALYERVDDLEINGGGGSGSGEINYIDNPNAESDTIGWVTYNDGAVAIPIDGVDGTASHLTLTRQNTFVIRDLYSFRLAKAVLDGQGEGLSFDFTIDKADLNKLLKISFDYNTDGAYANEDLKCYIYDVTNATLITPADNGIIGVDKDDNSSGARTISWASTDSLSYRLVFHVATTNASAYDFYFDNVIVGPGSVATGAVVTAWESYTPAATQGFPTGASVKTFSQRRVGDSLYIRLQVTAGTQGSGEIQFNLPTGLTADSTKINVVEPGGGFFGNGSYDTSVEDRSIMGAWDSSTNIALYRTEESSGSPLSGANVGVRTMVFESGPIPIAEWAGSGTVNLMSDNVAAANASSAWQITDTSYTDGDPIDFDTEHADYTNVNTWANTNGSITIPSDGKYLVACTLTATAALSASKTLDLRIGGTVVRVLGRSTADSNAVNGTTLVQLSKGDLLTMTLGQSATLASDNNETHLSVIRQQDYSAGQPVGFGNATATTPGLVYKPAADVVTYTAGNISTTSTSLVDLTGATITLVLPTAGRVAFAFTGSITMTGGIGTFIMNVSAGGTLQLGTSGTNVDIKTAGALHNASFSGITGELAAGSHVIKVQWLVGSNTGLVSGTPATPYVFSAWAI